MKKNIFKNLTARLKKKLSPILDPVVGYTRMVFATKYLLASFAFILVAILIFLPLKNSLRDNYRLTFSKIEKTASDADPVMVNPRFQGVDSDDQTYIITAKTAVRKKDDSLELNSINADINLKDESWVALIANKAFFQYNAKKLQLRDFVSLFTHEGYEFSTESMDVDIDKNKAQGVNKVQGQGPIGSLEADSFFVEDKGNIIRFKGNVKITLYPNVADQKKYYW